MSPKAAQIREGAVDTPYAELPEGWISIRLEEHVYIAGRIGWRGLKAEEYTAAGPILLSVPNLNYGDTVDFRYVNHISRARYEESPEIQVRPGDILLVKDGAGIGKLGYVDTLPADATVNSSLLLVRPQNRLIYAKYLFYYFKGPEFQSIALNRITGSATPHLFQKDIKLFQILIAPLDEQYRIAEKIEALSAQVDQARMRLSRLPVLIKNFRQAILAAACSGRLTEDWRNRTGLMATPDGELLQTWHIRRLDSLFSVRTGGTPLRKVSEYYRGGTIPWVKTGELGNADITSVVEYITPRAVDESNAKVFPPGTILIAMYGEGKTRGKIGRLKFPAATNQACAALINTNLPPETNEYVFTYLLGQYEILRAEAVGGNQPNLNLSIVKAVEIPIPPPEEQREIVRRVETLFKLADAIEKRVAAATLRAERLTQAILAKAFRGELVSTEAELARSEGRDYEPASALLEQIRATTGKTSEGSVNGKKRRRLTLT